MPSSGWADGPVSPPGSTLMSQKSQTSELKKPSYTLSACLGWLPSASYTFLLIQKTITHMGLVLSEINTHLPIPNWEERKLTSNSELCSNKPTGQLPISQDQWFLVAQNLYWPEFLTVQSELTSKGMTLLVFNHPKYSHFQQACNVLSVRLSSQGSSASPQGTLSLIG